MGEDIPKVVSRFGLLLLLVATTIIQIDYKKNYN